MYNVRYSQKLHPGHWWVTVAHRGRKLIYWCGHKRSPAALPLAKIDAGDKP